MGSGYPSQAGSRPPREPASAQQASAQQAWDREGITRSQLGATAGLGLESSRP